MDNINYSKYIFDLESGKLIEKKEFYKEQNEAKKRKKARTEPTATTAPTEQTH